MCGNFGFLGERTSSDQQAILPARVLKVFRQMGRETEIRGEQAGGGLVLARSKDAQTVFVGKKILKRKRGNLTQSLEAAFSLVGQSAITQGIKPLPSTIAGVWHYRYGTSSPPSILETHWHEWMPQREEQVWQVEYGKWVCSRKNVGYRITHNGDFNTWRIFGKQIDTVHLGLWLERVLHTPNETQGDSPKIAGMIDFLATQGMWIASLRLAYQLEIAGTIEAAFGGQTPAKDARNTAPSMETLKHLAKICERIWKRHSDSLPLSGKANLACFEDQILKITQHFLLSPWPYKKRVAFVRAAVDAFLHNDLYRATQIFISRAEGSFGLVSVSTLSADTLVLSSHRQPMTVGFNLPETYMVYASEPAAVDTVLAGIPESYRLDLNQSAGEVAQVGKTNLTIYSVAEGRELLESEIADRWISMQNTPSVRRPAVEQKDPVASDIREIPHALKAIEADWYDPDGLNRKSADCLTDLFIEKVRHFYEKRENAMKAGWTEDLGQSEAVDFLITGIENSLWLGERFAEDLKIVFPLLNIKAISANRVLRQLKHDPQCLQLGKDSVVLAISQSGQTFPTLQATEVFERLYRANRISGLFVLTGEFRSLMGATISQSHLQSCRQGKELSHRIFTTGSGRRLAEPSTVTVATGQATLTEILLYIAKRTRQAFPDASPFGMVLTEDSLSALEEIKADFLDQRVVSILQTNASGATIKSSENRKLTKSGRKWALHITEVPLAWGIHALYILIVLGWTVPFGYTLSVTQVFLHLVLWPVGLSANAALFDLILPVSALADIAIAIFGPWLWTLGLRYFQGRQLLARTGRRTLVIADTPWVNQLLESYVSKLFSLSYGIASLEVHGTNPQDHMLHQFGHRITRGTLVFLGIPDGRHLEIQKNDEDAVVMTGKQADGVRSIGAGPEIVALGHNPEIYHKRFDDTILLKCASFDLSSKVTFEQQTVIEQLRESRFSSFERLLASYVLFWALAEKVASLPLLRYQHWKSQSRTRVATTAAPVSGINQFDRGLFKITSTSQKSFSLNGRKRGLKEIV